MKAVVKLIDRHPKIIFLVDSIGAFISAIFLGVILVYLEEYIGIPPKILYSLAFLACSYAIFSMYSYKANLKNWKMNMKVISIANLTHCILTCILLYTFKEKLSVWGFGYFIIEILIVIPLAIFEYRLACCRN